MLTVHVLINTENTDVKIRRGVVAGASPLLRGGRPHGSPDETMARADSVPILRKSGIPRDDGAEEIVVAAAPADDGLGDCGS